MIETNGGFLRLGKNTWVRGEAIVVIRGRPRENGEESAEVVVRGTSPTSPNAYSVWTDHSVADIIGAIAQANGEGRA